MQVIPERFLVKSIYPVIVLADISGPMFAIVVFVVLCPSAYSQKCFLVVWGGSCIDAGASWQVPA